MSKKQEQELETTGHSWDGIEELNSPLPRWWLYTFYLTIIWGIGYTIAYPAWPLINQATAGVLGYSTRAEVSAEIARVDAANADVNAKLATVDLASIGDDPGLSSYAFSAGGAVFRTWCAQCHGSGAAGAKGYPNLLDDDWLWGGTVEDIHATISHGIRTEEDDEARWSEMPAFGDILERSEIAQVVAFVTSLSASPQDIDTGSVGAQLYADNCAACHGDLGRGDMDQGAPNLADAIWLYGGDTEAITETVTNARFGVMPAWQSRLTEAEIRAVSTYVHSLGGGQ